MFQQFINPFDKNQKVFMFQQFINPFDKNQKVFMYQQFVNPFKPVPEINQVFQSSSVFVIQKIQNFKEAKNVSQ